MGKRVLLMGLYVASCRPTGQNIRKLIKDGFVIRKPTIIHSRARARLSAEAKSKGRHTGYGEQGWNNVPSTARIAASAACCSIWRKASATETALIATCRCRTDSELRMHQQRFGGAQLFDRVRPHGVSGLHTACCMAYELACSPTRQLRTEHSSEHAAATSSQISVWDSCLSQLIGVRSSSTSAPCQHWDAFAWQGQLDGPDTGSAHWQPRCTCDAAYLHAWA